MDLPTHLVELVRLFREAEGAQTRGPRFVTLAEAIHKEASKGNVSRRMVLDCLGVPDMFGGDEVYVYYFDLRTPGMNRDEWYFIFKADRLDNNGYNSRGVNDLSKMRPKSEFPEHDA